MSATANGGVAPGRAGSVLRLRSARIALAVLAAIAVLAAFGPTLAPQGRSRSTPTRCSRGRAGTTCSVRITSAATC